MRAKHFWFLALGGLAIVASAPGCGDDPAPVTSGGSSSSSSSSSSSGKTSSSSSSSSGIVEDSNVDCDSGDALETMFAEGPTLEPVEDDEDFYTFDGIGGLYFQILTDSKPDADEFDATYPDLVITLYKDNNGTWEQIARNDDPTPRFSNDSELYTVLPSDGKYCVKVSECSKVFGPNLCSNTADITSFGYMIAGGTINAGMVNGIVQEVEPNDMAANATPMEYEKVANMMRYYSTLTYGGFSSPTDVDIYSFKVPMDQSVPSGRSICNFDFFPFGVDGNGSSVESGGLAYITTAAEPTKKIAQIDFTAADPKSGELPSIGVPCTFGTDYLFFLERGMGATKGVNDFNMFTHVGGGSNPLEKETEMTPNINDKIADAEALMVQNNMDGSKSFFVDGDIIGAPMDKDVFAIDVAAGANLATISVACGSQRSGSGLRDFRATVFDDKGNPLSMGIATESATSSLFIDQRAIPAGATKLFLQLEAGSQDPNVSSTFYRCGIHLSPPAN